MAAVNKDEKRLKKCLQTVIKAVSDSITDLEAQPKANQQESLDDLKDKVKQILDESLSTLSPACQNYLLNILYEYNYNDEEQTLSNSFNINMVRPFLQALQGTLSSLDAFQGAWNGDQPIVDDFIKNYPTFRDKSGLYGTTLLYCAARNNHFNLVKYLIEIARCSVNSQNEEYNSKGEHSQMKPTNGSTALHAACFHGHLPIVKYLIKHGGDYFISNDAYETPIRNGLSKSNILNFFQDFLIGDYLHKTNNLPDKTILQEIEQHEEQIIDCIWEYKSFSDNQWLTFPDNESSELQQTLFLDSDKTLNSEIRLKITGHSYTISMIQFVGTDKDHNLAWIRCRGSSLRNFHLYSQWQIMFIHHPTGISNSSSSIEIFPMATAANKVQFDSWYNCDDEMNFLLERAMNYRRKFLILNFDFIGQKKLIFDLEEFTFINHEKTISGFLRWIPKIISNDRKNKNKLIIIDNFQLPKNVEPVLLTTSRFKQAQTNGNISTTQINQYHLKVESIFDNNDDDEEDYSAFKSKDSPDVTDLSKLINVHYGNLTTEKSDVIVICSSSKYLLESVFKAGGKSVQRSFDTKVKETPKSPVISVLADGKLASKTVYFIPWHPNSDSNILCQSIKALISNTIKKAVSEKYTSISYPAIGCGEYGCSVSLVAETFIREVQRQLTKYPMSVSFVIQEDKTDIYDEFQKQIDLFQHQEESTETKTVSVSIGKGIIEVEKGDITKQRVDVIIGSSSSENLRQALIKAGGIEVQNAFAKQYQNNPNSLIISTPPGQLPCKRIFFLTWEPDKNEDILRQSIVDLIWNLIQNVNSHNFTSIAFPAIGCGEHACSVDIVVKTMVREMRQQIMARKLPWTVKFVIEPSQPNVYNEFCKQVLSSQEDFGTSFDHQWPSTWKKSTDSKLRCVLSPNKDEFKSIVTNFDETMRGQYTEIIKIERIQNERWYMQYFAHSMDFKKRLNSDTEKRLYHGCPEQAANLIIEDCFNRSFAGVNGTAYGVGVYFSSSAAYSHGYTRPNVNGERCIFLARVLIGKTTLGNSSMKTRPVGFDSTTDGKNMFITYHDAQAYAEYLITYR